ncbi:pseudouridine synthase [Corynebacterium alimapuense]|uniref:pseudouridine synthase n=1 Tax=Corynebacterium alimapuense TaxID=1576874 RepID=UPI001FE35851|nr:pseudouridine synthase [Corynebacterium alimapuense]
MPRPPIPAQAGISPQRVILRGVVPETPELFAGQAGDSPFPPGQRLLPGTVLQQAIPAWFHPEVPAEPEIPFNYELIHIDDDLVVVDKPHFLPSTSNGRIVRETVQTRLRLHFGQDEIVALHRLDRLTSGVLICSRRAATRGAYQRLFQERAVHKTYLAQVHGTPPEGQAKLDLHKIPGRRDVQVVANGQGKPTVTSFRPVGKNLVEVEPLTGHTHQIRAVLNHLGAPIVGDDTYPVDRGLALYDFSTPLHLWATKVSLNDPFSGDHRVFYSRRPLPR